MNDFSAVLNVHPDKLLSLNMTAIQTLSKETFHFKLSQIEWNSRNEKQGIILIKNSIEGALPTTVLYSSIAYAFDNMEEYSLIRLYHKLINLGAIQEEGIHFFSHRDMSYPSLFTMKNGNITIKSNKVNDLNNLVRCIRNSQPEGCSEIIYTQTKGVTPKHKIKLGAVTILLTEGNYLEFYSPQTLNEMIAFNDDIIIQVRNGEDVRQFINYLAYSFDAIVLTP